MKKTLLSVLFASGSLLSYSQIVIPKGKTVIGSSVSIGINRSYYDSIGNRQNPSTFRQFTSTFTPSIAWAKKDNQLYGILFHTEYGTWKDESGTNLSKGKYYIAGPGVFYERFFNLGKGFNFSAYGALRGTYGVQNYTKYSGSVITEENTGKTYNVNFSVTPRIGYAFNNKWMIQASFGEMLDMNYSSLNLKRTPAGGMTTESNYKDLRINTRLTRGFSLSNLGLTLRYNF